MNSLGGGIGNPPGGNVLWRGGEVEKDGGFEGRGLPTEGLEWGEMEVCLSRASD